MNAEILSLTEVAKNCFTPETQNNVGLIAVIAQVQTLLNLQSDHNVRVSVNFSPAKRPELMVDVAMVDYADGKLGMLVKKEYDVQEGDKFFRITPMHSDLDDSPEDVQSPRLLHTYEFHDLVISGEMFIATLITDIREFMTPDAQVKFGNNPALQTSELPIAAAFRTAFPATEDGAFREPQSPE